MPDLAGAGIMPSIDGKHYNREGIEPLIVFDKDSVFNEVSTKKVNYSDAEMSGRRAKYYMDSMPERKRN